MQANKSIVEKDHPELSAGGYTHDDSTVEFYQRVLAVLPEGAVVLDLGAGRGARFTSEDSSRWRGWLTRLGKRYPRRIGADISPDVKSNPEIDEAIIIEAGKPLPYADQTFDLVLCDWVVEHIEAPELFVAEVRRVLKIGGWFCARTPNRWSHFPIGSRILPASIRDIVLFKLAPSRNETFQTHYKLNTLGALAKRFQSDSWINGSYFHNDVGYHGDIPWLYRLISLYQKLMPRSLSSVIMIFMHKVA